MEAFRWPLVGCLLGLFVSGFSARADDTVSGVGFVVQGGMAEAHDPYVCNAGIRHVPELDQVCRRSITGEVCEPEFEPTPSPSPSPSPDSDASTPPSAENQSCVCVADTGGKGDILRFMTFAGDEGRLEADSSETWTTVHDFRSGNPFQADPIVEVEFRLGSLLYAAEYFVDVCFPAPRFAPEQSIGHHYQGRVLSSNLLGGERSYANLARPTLRVSQIFGNGDCIPSPAEITILSNPVLSPYALSWYLRPNRRCVIRMEFAETSKNLRSWQRVKERFLVQFDIPEAPVED